MNKIKKLIGFIRDSFSISEFKSITEKQDLSIFTWYLFNTLVGFILSEIFYFGQVIGNAFYSWVAITHIIGVYLAIALSVILLIAILIYVFCRIHFESFNFYIKNIKFYCARLFFSFMGIGISYNANGVFYEEYQKLISRIYLESLIFIVAIPAAIGFVFLLMALAKLFKTENGKNQSLFLSDSPIVNLEDDLLDVDKNAQRFTKLVLNRNSSDSFVFGIDSPWGVGKTSFINRCKEIWSHLEEDTKPIVVSFDPIKYLSQDKLSEKLANEISQTLNKHSRNPFLNKSFDRYVSILKENNQISFFGMNFKLPLNLNFMTELTNLEKEIVELDRKIIIVIDDLDRLSWEESKKILYGIKQSFNLKRVS